MADEGARSAAPPGLAADRMGRLYVCVLAVWALLPVIWYGQLAQDGLSLHVAASIALDHPEDVYVAGDGGLFDVAPAFAAEGCPSFPSAQECDDFLVAFVSAPVAIPLVLPLRALPVDPAMLLLRLIGAGALVAGMVLVWRRIAGLSPQAPAMLLATAVALTPLATAPINLGQTSPLLFLSAILGVGAAHRFQVGRALLWTTTIALKLFPAALGALLLARRWRMLATTAATLVVLALLTLPLGLAEVWPSFLDASSALSDQAAPNPYNGSIEAVLHQVADLTVEPTDPLALVLRVLLAAGIVALVLRFESDDARWAVGWLGAVTLMPQAWWHYSWVAVAALAVVLHERQAARSVWLLPAFAVVALPVSVANTRGWSVPTAQLALLLATLGAIAWLQSRTVSSDLVPEHA